MRYQVPVEGLLGDIVHPGGRLEEEVVGHALKLGPFLHILGRGHVDGLDDFHPRADIRFDGAAEVFYHDRTLIALELYEIEFEVVDTCHDGLGHLIAEESHAERFVFLADGCVDRAAQREALVSDRRIVRDESPSRRHLCQVPGAALAEVESYPIDIELANLPYILRFAESGNIYYHCGKN